MIGIDDLRGARLFWLVAVSFFIAGFMIYSNVIIHGVFLFDDFEYVVGNSLIQDFSTFSLSDSRQVGYLSFMLNYAVGGENPVGYHLVNVVVHVLNALLVFSLARLLVGLLAERIKPDYPYVDGISLLTGLLFLVHPIQTQAVSYITQRFTSLSTLFYFLAIVSYLKARVFFEKSQNSRRGHVFFVFSLLSALLAMRTKEIAFTIPFALFLLEFALFPTSVYKKRRYVYLIPHLALLTVIPLSIFGPEFGLGGAGAGIAEITRKEKIYDLLQRPLHEYLFTQFKVIVIYIRLLLLPVGQRVVYDIKVARSLADPWVLSSLASLLSLAGAALFFWKRSSKTDSQESVEDKLVSLGIAWFFLTLSIESSFIPIKDLIFEHRVYLPSFGFLLAAAVVLIQLARKSLKTHPPSVIIGTLVCIIVLPLSVGAYARNAVWTDEVKFWDDVVQKNPSKAIGYHNRGNAYAKVGRFDLALQDIDRTISYFPTGRDASGDYESADFTAPNMSKTYMNRAQIYEILGNTWQAETDFARARAVFSSPPIDVKQTLKLADLYAKRGAFTHAIEELNNVLLWEPDNLDALNDRANAYSWTRNYRDAIRDLTRIIKQAPDGALAYHNRGIAYAWSKRKELAVADFRKACKLGFQPSCDSIAKIEKATREGR